MGDTIGTFFAGKQYVLLWLNLSLHLYMHKHPTNYQSYLNSAILYLALGTTPPNTTLSQNNGIVSLTRCASADAGFACGFWLLIFGVIAKIGAWILSVSFDTVIDDALLFHHVMSLTTFILLILDPKLCSWRSIMLSVCKHHCFGYQVNRFPSY